MNLSNLFFVAITLLFLSPTLLQAADDAPPEKSIFQTTRLSVELLTPEDLKEISTFEKGDKDHHFRLVASGVLYDEDGYSREEKLAEKFNEVKEEHGLYKTIRSNYPTPLDFPPLATCALRSRESREFVGYIVFETEESGYISFGWALLPKFRGQGFGSEFLNSFFNAYRPLLGEEFPDFTQETSEKWTFRGFTADVDIHNGPSLGALSKFMQPLYLQKSSYIGFETLYVHLWWGIPSEAPVDAIAPNLDITKDSFGEPEEAGDQSLLPTAPLIEDLSYSDGDESDSGSVTSSEDGCRVFPISPERIGGLYSRDPAVRESTLASIKEQHATPGSLCLEHTAEFYRSFLFHLAKGESVLLLPAPPSVDWGTTKIMIPPSNPANRITG